MARQFPRLQVQARPRDDQPDIALVGDARGADYRQPVQPRPGWNAAYADGPRSAGMGVFELVIGHDQTARPRRLVRTCRVSLGESSVLLLIHHSARRNQHGARVHVAAHPNWLPIVAPRRRQVRRPEYAPGRPFLPARIVRGWRFGPDHGLWQMPSRQMRPALLPALHPQYASLRMSLSLSLMIC